MKSPVFLVKMEVEKEVEEKRMEYEAAMKAKKALDPIFANKNKAGRPRKLPTDEKIKKLEIPATMKVKIINQLKKYNDLNYTFNAEMSDSQNLVFTRNR